MNKELMDEVLKDLLTKTSVSHNVNDFPVGAFFLNLSEMPLGIINWHWHEEVEFIIINSGHISIRFADDSFVLSPGEGIFINQNLLHSIQAVGKEECSMYVLKFHPSFLFSYYQPYLTTKYLTPVLTSSTLHFLHLKENSKLPGELLNLANSAIACFMAKRFGYELMMTSILLNIWCHLLKLNQTSDSQMKPLSKQFLSDSTRIKQALLFIEKYHMEPLTLDEIADSIHISKSECCRCFQRSLGLTPFEYLLKFRVFESTRKMLNGAPEAESISTLAAAVGFNSVSYYNKLFKKYMNCTPTEYKKSIQSSLFKKARS